MLWAFLAPTFASGPDGVPVAGPEPVAGKLLAQAEQQEEHPDFITVSSQEEAEAMVRDREVVGAIAIGEAGATVYTASGNGAPYVQMLGGDAQNLEATNSSHVAPKCIHDLDTQTTSSCTTTLALRAYAVPSHCLVLVDDPLLNSSSLKTLGRTRPDGIFRV